MMIRLVANIMPALALAALAAGCASGPGKRAGEEPAAAGRENASGAFSNRDATAEGGRGGGRGFGRNASGKVTGRGRRSYSPVRISPVEKEAIRIETVKAAYRSLRTLHTAMGKVLAPQTRTAIVSYAFPARTAEVHVRIGDWVKAGQKLLTLQSEEVGSAKSAYYRATADFELAKANHERERRLYDRGVGAQKNLIATEAELKVAEANLNAAEKKLHVLGFSEEDVAAIALTHQINPVIDLFAPVGGKIIEHNAVLGAMIDQSTELLTIMDPSVLWVDAEIFERDIAKIRNGQNVQVSVPAYPGETFNGKISYIGDLLNEETRTITVRTEVANGDYKLKPGMFADVNILLNHRARSLVLPSTSILDDQGEQIVFIKGDGEYIPTIVDIGAKENGFCEVLSGIREGEEVVTVGNYQLKSKLYDDLLKKAGVH